MRNPPINWIGHDTGKVPLIGCLTADSDWWGIVGRGTHHWWRHPWVGWNASWIVGRRGQDIADEYKSWSLFKRVWGEKEKWQQSLCLRGPRRCALRCTPRYTDTMQLQVISLQEERTGSLLEMPQSSSAVTTITCTRTFQHFALISKDKIPIKPFPQLMKMNVPLLPPVYRQLCAYPDHCGVKQSVRPNYLLFIIYLLFPAFLLLPCQTASCAPPPVAARFPTFA